MFTPTPEQMAILEKTRSFKEKENLVEMWELEAQSRVPVQPDTPVESAVPAPEVSKVVETETQEQKPVVEPVLAEPPPSAPESPEQNVDYWKQQAETWKKRKGDADRALTPAQQEAARLRKEQERFEERFSNIEKMLQRVVETKPRAVDPDPEDEVDANYPEVARKIRNTAQGLEERLRGEQEARIRQIEERSKRYEEESEGEKQRLYMQSHFAQLKAIHPDAEDFISENKLGPALVEWVKTQPSELMDAISNPLGHTPQYVGYVISQFKNATRYAPSAPHKPSLGDLAVKANSATQVKQVEPELDTFPNGFTEKDFDTHMRRINNLNKYDGKKLDAELEGAIAKWDRTLTKRNT